MIHTKMVLYKLFVCIAQQIYFTIIFFVNIMKVVMSFYKRQIGHEHYTYDANGNPTRVENDSTAAVREYRNLLYGLRRN